MNTDQIINIVKGLDSDKVLFIGTANSSYIFNIRNSENQHKLLSVYHNGYIYVEILPDDINIKIQEMLNGVIIKIVLLNGTLLYNCKS